MDTEYNVGTGTGKVYLKIIATPKKEGVLVTPEVKLYPRRKPQPTLEQANDFTFTYNLGTRDDIKGTMIKIELVFDVKNLSTQERKKFFDNLKIKYELTGGLSDESFEHDLDDIKEDSDTGKTIITRKDIYLN